MSEIISNLYISDKHHVPTFHTDYDLIVNCTPDIPFPLMHNSIIRIPVYDHPSHAGKMHDIIKKNRSLKQFTNICGKVRQYWCTATRVYNGHVRLWRVI